MADLRQLPPTLVVDLAAPKEAATMLRRLGNPVIAFCAKDPQSRLVIEKAPDGLYGQLKAGKVPDFLDALPVTAGTGLKLFRLNPESMGVSPEKP